MWPVLGAIILVLAGCRNQTQPRVVRLALNSSSADWRLSVNGTNRSGDLADSTLTKELVRLRLRQGDVMLITLPRARQTGSVKRAEEWLSHYCQSNSVAVYLVLDPFPGVEIFSVRAYHWTAPYDNPFDLARASFFCEGQFLGQGRNGFEEMLGHIERERPRQVFILGSLFDLSRSFPPDSSPYEHQRDRLDNVLKASGTDFIQLDALPGF